MRIAKTTGLPDRRGQGHIIHGDARVGKRVKLFGIWAGILRRCNNPNDATYKRYGARGIRVCERWLDYVNFRADMGAGWAPGLSIERNDNSGNYELSNCRWATRKEQCRNRRSNRIIEYRGEKRTVIEWGEVLGVPWARFYQRIVKLGWPVDRAMTEPARSWAHGIKKIDPNYVRSTDGNKKIEEMV